MAHNLHSRSVPGLIAIGIASWILIGAALAMLHRGHWGPVVVGIGVFLTAVALLCREAVRHQRSRNSVRVAKGR